MRRLNFYAAMQAIERMAEKELTDILKSIGGEFIDSNCDVDPLIITGQINYKDGSEDIVFTKAMIDNAGEVAIYGFPYDGRYDEQELDFMEKGYNDDIIDRILSQTEIDTDYTAQRIDTVIEVIARALLPSPVSERWE